MRLLLVISLFMYCSSQLTAERFQVVAKSGLVVRAEPNVSSKRLDVVPYGDFVEGHFDSSESMESGKSKKEWVSVWVNGVKGFMYSAYLIPEVPKWEKVDQHDLIILPKVQQAKGHKPPLSANCFQARFFDPSYFWYGMKDSAEGALLEAVELKISHGIMLESTDDNPDSELGEIEIFYFDISHELEFDRLVVSKFPIEKGWVDSKKENLNLVDGEEVGIESSNGQVYQFNYSDNQERKGVDEEWQTLLTLTVGEELETDLYEYPKAPVFFEISWVGDLNRDSYLDFIVKETSFFDCCGCHPNYRLVFSDSNQDKKLSYKLSNRYW